MGTIHDVAGTWHAAGVSTIPILDNGTKRPAIRWGDYQQVLPDTGQLNEWWGNGHANLGLALICGTVSGNLEMTEIEADGAGSESLITIQNALDEAGYGYLWDLFTSPQGYMEWSPSGGIHFLYRITDHPVPGNEKIAHRSDGKVISETRGEGGYVIVAPTSGLVHPSGESWSLAAGQYGRVPEISWMERCAFQAALREVLDEPQPVRAELVPMPRTPLGLPARSDRPGDIWAATISWQELLERFGFTYSHSHGVEEFYARPGKSAREGHSVTVNFRGSDTLKCFSTSIPELTAGQTYSKFGVLAAFQYRGNLTEAARDLARQGFGAPPSAPVQPLDELDILPEQVTKNKDASRHKDEFGMSYRIRDLFGDEYRWIVEENRLYRWTGQRWEPDLKKGFHNRYMRLTTELLEKALDDDDRAMIKFMTSMRTAGKSNALIHNLSAMDGVSLKTEELNPDRELINVQNGILNLRTGELLEHDKSYLMTRMFGASYDPSATCPNFDKFLSEVLPDPAMREYVQRAVGYTLLGKPNRRAMFLIHGPSGTGKTQFIELMQMVFGDYATTAPAGTFRATRDKAPSHDLHQLRGKRFVSTSETSETASFDEDLIKRVTGGDKIQSRELYERHQEWKPECTVWIATNYPPRFNSDDDAIWRRAKLIPFLTQFTEDGEHREIPDLAEEVLIHEADGILNWIMAGVQAFLEHGLDEPGSVKAATQEHRESADPVLRFLDDRLSEAVLVMDPDGRIPTMDLHQMYNEWARQCGERTLGQRRFKHRIESSQRPIFYTPTHNRRMWTGLRRGEGASMFGTFMVEVPESS